MVYYAVALDTKHWDTLWNSRETPFSWHQNVCHDRSLLFLPPGSTTHFLLRNPLYRNIKIQKQNTHKCNALNPVMGHIKGREKIGTECVRWMVYKTFFTHWHNTIHITVAWCAALKLPKSWCLILKMALFNSVSNSKTLLFCMYSSCWNTQLKISCKLNWDGMYTKEWRQDRDG